MARTFLSVVGRTVIFFALCLVLFPAAAEADRDTEDKQLYWAEQSAYDHNPDLESSALLTASGRARRDGDTLYLTPSEATEYILTDSSDDDCEKQITNCETYRLAAYLPTRHAFLVIVGYYEGRSWALVDDRTGEVTDLPGVPHFSPDDQRLFVSDMSLSDGGRNIAIWRRDGRTWAVEWSRDPVAGATSGDGYFCGFVSWKGDRIDLKFWREWNDDRKPVNPWSAVVTKDGAGWRLRTTRPK